MSGIAQRKSIAVSSDMAAKDNALPTRLSKLSGGEFDRAYMSAMVRNHENDVAAFRKEADKGHDADLKGFASKTLPTLEEHPSMAKDAASAVGAR